MAILLHYILMLFLLLLLKVLLKVMEEAFKDIEITKALFWNNEFNDVNICIIDDLDKNKF